MPRKTKMSKEEQQKEIDRIVAERIAKQRKEDNRKAQKEFIEKALDLLLYQMRYTYIRQSYAFATAIRLINLSDLSEEDKDEVRLNFATDIVFAGGGVKEEDFDKARKKIEEIKEYLRGNH